MNQLPILYSFRRCPYAIRARLAIKVSMAQVELREIKLADKPGEMLACSPKGTVPVLLLPNGDVIDESYDVMLWALNQSDPKKYLSHNLNIQNETSRLIDLNDGEFKKYLDLYKYADRFPDKSREYYRQQAEDFLMLLEENLNKSKFLLSDKIALIDIAIFPFVRQFAFVDKDWFDSSKYIKLQNWLRLMLETQLFHDVMQKVPLWNKENNIVSIL